MAKQDWRYAVIRGLGGKVTPQTLSFLSGWQRKEGGHTNNTARWNWLNRTDTGYPSAGTSQKSIVAYPDYQTGVARTVDLIRSGYPALAGSLQSGNISFSNPGVQGDLNRWLTGKRTPGMTPYVSSVAKLAGMPAGPAGAAAPAAAPAAAAPAAIAPRQADLSSVIPLIAALSSRREQRAAGQRPEIGGLVGALMGMRQQPVQRPTAAPPGMQTVKTPAGVLQAPVSPTGTHVTSGLGWGTRTAQDIMRPPGTPVASPVNGQVVYFHPTGAQGGGSMLIRADDGHEYWLGHIANALQAGTRVRAGQVISYVSPDHANPHLHIDRR